MKFGVDPLGLARVTPGPKGSWGNLECIFVTSETYVTTFISDIF